MCSSTEYDPNDQAQSQYQQHPAIGAVSKHQREETYDAKRENDPAKEKPYGSINLHVSP